MAARSPGSDGMMQRSATMGRSCKAFYQNSRFTIATTITR